MINRLKGRDVRASAPLDRQVKVARSEITHLTQNERHQIAILSKAGHDQSEISKVMNQRLYADKCAGGTLHRTLRCQKLRRKRYGRHERRGTIPNQASINLRPAVVAELGRFGDWEGDLVIGAGHKQALVTRNERSSLYSLIAHLPFKTAQAVSDAMLSLLMPSAAGVHTMTTDNAKEFAQHERVAKELDADFVVAHPYASWKRGANENTNGLIRQFFPEKMRFKSITPTDVELAMHRLNHHPRKCLGFKTPHEVSMNQIHARHNTVALQT